MINLTLAIIVFIVAFGAFLLGLRVRRSLPQRYTDEATMASVKQSVGQMAILATVVLGFITGSAVNNFNASSTLVTESAIRFATLDRILANLGSPAANQRGELKIILERQVNRMRSTTEATDGAAAIIERGAEFEAFQRRLASIKPESDLEATELRRAQDQLAELRSARWMFRLDGAAGLPIVFLLFILMCFAIDFFYIGLNSPDNTLVILTAVCVALCTASAMFLTLELEGPMSGMIRVSPGPLEQVLTVLCR